VRVVPACRGTDFGMDKLGFEPLLLVPIAFGALLSLFGL
jgi:hypothetical protein